MYINELGNNLDKINKKEELIELLKKYKRILSDPILEYLDSLIELEFSVIREYISDDERKSLSELDIYRRIAIYNIYNRALKLFKDNKIRHRVSSMGSEFGELTISVPLGDKRSIKVFDFDYKDFSSDGSITFKIPSEYRTMRIGDVSLFQTLENKELRDAEIKRMMSKLERLYDTHNPYLIQHDLISGPQFQWDTEHSFELTKYEKRLAELECKKELDKLDRKEIKITNQI